MSIGESGIGPTPVGGKSRYSLDSIFVGSKAIWAIMLILMSISLWIIFSASSAPSFRALDKGQDFFRLYRFHIFYMMGSIAICVLVSHMPVKYFRDFAKHLLFLSIFLLVYVLIFGDELNEAKRSFSIGPFSFQPSELARLTLINYVAAQLRFKEGIYATAKNFWLIFAATAGVCLLIFKENMSTSLILGSVVFYMCYLGGANRKLLSRFFWGAIAAATIVIFLLVAFPSIRNGEILRLGTGYGRVERFVTQLTAPINTETFDDIDGVDRQVVASQRAIANSHFFGVGFGHSEMRNMLPEPYSDFVFSLLIEEGGIPVAVIVVLTYLALFFAIGGIARRTTSVYNTLLVLGIGLIITLQAILHMLICVNLFPITGQNLPFISRGGSSYIVTAIYFGILLSVSRENKIKEDQRIAQAAGNEVVTPEPIPEMLPMEQIPTETTEL